MKRITFCALCYGTLLLIPAMYATPSYEIQIQPQWQDMENSSQRTKQFKSKWIWAGTFIVKKRSKHRVFLNTLDLQWHGKKIKHLSASLFKKDPNHKLLPVEDSLISDGIWNNSQQTLHFVFDHKEKLNPVNTFCLVLTIPKNLEPVLRKGHFHVKQETLPNELQEAVRKKTLSLFLKPPKVTRAQKLSFYRQKK